MIAARTHEQGGAAERDGLREAESAHVELPGCRDVADRQVNMPDGRVAAGGLCGVRLVVIEDERVRVEAQGGHLDLAVHPRPLRAVAVPVQLDAVAFGVGEVEGLADEVVGASGEGAGRGGRDGEDGRRKFRTGRKENRGVEEAGLPR